jgi:peptide chain release factor subunit 1
MEVMDTNVADGALEAFMFTIDETRSLEEFDAGTARVLSVYLDLDAHDAAGRSYLIALADLLKEIRPGFDVDTQIALDHEADRVAVWLDENRRAGNGLVVFSCEPRGLWKAQYLQVPVQDHVVFEPRPDVAPLLELLDEFERFAVALVDKSHARLFTVFAGEIEAIESFEDYVPPHHRQGGLSQANMQRHHEAHVFRHLKRVADRLTELQRKRSFDRLVIAGPDEAVSELRRILPRPLASRVAAVIGADPHATPQDILEKTLQVERQAERAVEQQLLDEIFEKAGAGGRATVGLARTLDALWLGDVQTLVVAHGVHAPGCECDNCGRLEAGTLDKCPMCGSKMHPVHDVFHRAMAKTLEQSGSVETVHGDPAQRLRQSGGLGAILRYQLPVTSSDILREARA